MFPTEREAVPLRAGRVTRGTGVTQAVPLHPVSGTFRARRTSTPRSEHRHGCQRAQPLPLPSAPSSSAPLPAFSAPGALSLSSLLSPPKLSPSAAFSALSGCSVAALRRSGRRPITTSSSSAAAALLHAAARACQSRPPAPSSCGRIVARSPQRVVLQPRRALPPSSGPGPTRPERRRRRRTQSEPGGGRGWKRSLLTLAGRAYGGESRRFRRVAKETGSGGAVQAGERGLALGPARGGGGRREAVGQGAELCGQEAEFPSRRRGDSRRGRWHRGTGRGAELPGAEVGRLLLSAAETGVRGGAGFGTALLSSPFELSPEAVASAGDGAVPSVPPRRHMEPGPGPISAQHAQHCCPCCGPRILPERCGQGVALACGRARRRQWLEQSGMLPMDPTGCPDGVCSLPAALVPSQQKPQVVESRP